MSGSDKALIAVIIHGCVANRAVDAWHDVRIEEIRQQSVEALANG